KVTAIALGEATITAASGEVTATCKVTVIPTPVESITLSVDTLDLKKGETAILTATVAPEDATDKTVTWTSDNEEVATVDSEGKVTAIALGEATITATSGEVTATCKVTVVPTPVESITLSNTSLNIVEGDKATLTVTITPDDATDKTVTWTSSDASVATVSANGEVTAVKVGTATITATSANGKTATCTVTVAPKIIDATDLTLNRNTAELKVGETLALEATVIPENATDKTVTWSSSDTSVATVDSIGKVTAIALGEVTITATSGEVTATCKVTVVPTPVESITLSDTSLSLIEGDTATLTAAVTPDDATDKTISWTSSDASVATVSANGEVTAVNAGTATITAATSNGMTATCTVTVAAKIIDATDLTLSLNTAELKVGETVTLEATVIPDNATDKTVTWKSDNEEVATVDSNGMVTAVSLGEATITAACGQVTATCKVTVVPTPVESITLSATSLDLIAGETAALTATVTPEDATDKTITWTSDNEEVASVSESGEVIAVKAGTATITVTSSNGKTATCTVTVAKRTGDFEYEGLWFTIIDDEAKTCRTKAGSFAEGNYTPGNDYIGDLSIPATTSDGVYEYSVVEIGRYGFATVTGLTSVSIPNTVSSVSEGAFYDCPALKTVDLSGSLKSLESMAFSGCNSNVAVTYRATTPIEATEEAFDSNAYKNGTLNTPNATLASVQAANPWRLFFNINASDGSISVPRNGEDFEIGGIIYTVVDDEDNILRTKEGDSGAAGNNAEGNFVIPGSVTAFDRDYTVTEIGDYGFSGNSDLLSVTIPVTVTNIGTGAFSDCERLTSLVWLGDTRLQSGVVEGIGNPNLLVYVNDLTYAPEGLDHNIVAGGVCDNLVLTPGYPFTPLYTFTANHSEITKEFTQQTPIEGCAGWETLAIPFEPTDITAYDGRALVPFAGLSDIDAQCPFWLYEADAEGEWKEASAIRQGVPYLVSMPDNDTYDEQYRIHGDVTFSTDTETVIAPETTVPYITTWASGREFRSLWLPLDAVEAANAMGLNVGIDDLTNDDGELLQPGSAFHVDVLPLPLEAYVTNIDGRRSMPVRGDQSFIKMISDGTGLRIAVDLGKITLSSDCDRSVDVVTMDGILLRRAHVKAGVAYKIENLTRGIYIVAGRKITVK
ncbi:MAG: Ig-like domain-containing protein, partial [Muribaculaceae bacterium]|nr:Ig-like domain-containing protein [Muribaculaceae bacterium]